MILLVPSRGRPDRADAMARSVAETTDERGAVQFLVDPDDPRLPEYRRLPWAVHVLTARIGYGAALNVGAAMHWDEHTILGAFGDDVVFRTPDWDRIVEATLERPGICYPNDLAHGQSWATAVWISSRTVKRLGWLALPGLWHQYVDNVWWELGHAVNRFVYLEEVVAEHMHTAYGKAENDQTYREVYSQPQAGIDHAAFLAWKREHMAADVARMRGGL